MTGVLVKAFENNHPGILSAFQDRADADLTVGRCGVLAISNFGTRSFLKDGMPGSLPPTYLIRTPPASGPSGFWDVIGSPAANIVFDPLVQYDPIADRYWAVALQYDSASVGSFSSWYVALAVTQGPDLGTDWWHYRLDMTPIVTFAQQIDRPSLSVDADRVYIALNGDNWRALVLAKEPLLNHTRPEVSVPDTDEVVYSPGQWSAAAAWFPGAGSPGIQYLIADGYGLTGTSAGFVTLHALRPDANPYTVYSINRNVQAYWKHNQALQGGSTVPIRTDDGRFTCAVFRNGSLWAVHTVRHEPIVSDPPTSFVRWYEFRMNDWPASTEEPALAQWGELSLPWPLYGYYPSIAVDSLGNAAITFNVSGPNKFVSMWQSVRCVSDPLGTFRQAVEIKAGSAAYESAFAFPHNFGDFSGTDPDPAAPWVFWGHAQLPKGNASPTSVWETWVAEFEAPCGLDVNGDGIADGSDATAFLGMFVQGQSQADYNSDGALTPQDLVAFTVDLYGPP